MAEKVYQTWERITGKPWSAAKAGGYTTGTYEANIALQKKLLSGWNPYASSAPTPQQTAQTSLTVPAPTGVEAQVQAASTALKALQADVARQLETTKQQRAAAEKERQTWIGKLKSEPIPKLEEKTEQLSKEWYIPEYREMLYQGVAKMDAALQEVNRLQAAQDEALAASEQRLAPVSFIRGEQALIQDKYGRQIANAVAIANAEAAKMDAIRGNVETARGFINDMVQAVTWEYKAKVQRIKDFININTTIVGELSDDERNLLNQTLTMAENELRRAQAEKALIGELMIAHPDANITPNMTLDQAYRAAQKSALAAKTEEQRRWEAEYALSLRQLQLSEAAARGKTPTEDDIKTWAEIVIANGGSLEGVPQEIITQVARKADALKKDPNWIREQIRERQNLGLDISATRTELNQLGIPSNLVDKYAPAPPKSIGLWNEFVLLQGERQKAVKERQKAVQNLFNKAKNAVTNWWTSR